MWFLFGLCFVFLSKETFSSRRVHREVEEHSKGRVIVESDEILREEVFQRILAGKLWIGNSFNVRAFISAIVGA